MGSRADHTHVSLQSHFKWRAALHPLRVLPMWDASGRSRGPCWIGVERVVATVPTAASGAVASLICRSAIGPRDGGTGGVLPLHTLCASGADEPHQAVLPLLPSRRIRVGQMICVGHGRGIKRRRSRIGAPLRASLAVVTCPKPPDARAMSVRAIVA